MWCWYFSKRSASCPIVARTASDGSAFSKLICNGICMNSLSSRRGNRLAVGADHERWHGLGVGDGILGTHTGPQHRKPKPKTKSSKSTKAKKKAPPKRAKATPNNYSVKLAVSAI